MYFSKRLNLLCAAVHEYVDNMWWCCTQDLPHSALVFSLDKSPSFRLCEGQGGDLFNISSSSSSCVKDGSSAENPAPAVETLFNDSSIQRIIDKYTKELNMSLSTTGKLAGTV